MDDAPGTRDVLLEFVHVLRDSSLEQGPARQLAARYQFCRTTLMSSELRHLLPGFVRQCTSLPKFREFIYLFDHAPERRMEFIEERLEDCWIELNEPPRRTNESSFDYDF